MNPSRTFSRSTPLERAFNFTLLISIFYVIYKFFDINSPNGDYFLSYIATTLFTDIILIFFPLSFVFFYFQDSNTVSEIKNNILNSNSCKINNIDSTDTLWEYHSMMKEGMLTQEEFDVIKKKHLQKLDKK